MIGTLPTHTRSNVTRAALKLVRAELTFENDLVAEDKGRCLTNLPHRSDIARARLDIAACVPGATGCHHRPRHRPHLEGQVHGQRQSTAESPPRVLGAWRTVHPPSTLRSPLERAVLPPRVLAAAVFPPRVLAEHDGGPPPRSAAKPMTAGLAPATSSFGIADDRLVMALLSVIRSTST